MSYAVQIAGHGFHPMDESISVQRSLQDMGSCGFRIRRSTPLSSAPAIDVGDTVIVTDDLEGIEYGLITASAGSWRDTDYQTTNDASLDYGSVTDAGTRVFAGTIERIQDIERPDTDTERIVAIEAVSYEQILNRFLVAKSFTNKGAGDIITDILGDELTDEGITSVNVQATSDEEDYGSVATSTTIAFSYASVADAVVTSIDYSLVTNPIVDGPLIRRAVYNYATAAEVFQELSDITGYHYFIDENKDCHFEARTTSTAGYVITDNSRPYRSIQVIRSRDRYRNVQYIRAGQAQTESRIEVFAGDGVQQVFSVKFPVAEVPTIETDIGAGYVARTVGIRGVDSSKDWYWNKGDRAITQDDAGTELISTDRLRVTYKGLYPLTALEEDSAEITARAAAEGGSGRYESVENLPNIDQAKLAFDRAEGLTRRFGDLPIRVVVETDESNFRAGQLVAITHTDLGLSGNYLIESVQMFDRGDHELRRTFTALSGEPYGSWARYFRGLSSTQGFSVRENEVLSLIRSNDETLSMTDSVTVTVT